MKNVGGLTLKNIKLRQEYESHKNRCQECNVELPFNKRRSKFCSSHCSVSHNNRLRKISESHKIKVSTTLKQLHSLGKIEVKNSKTCKTCELCGNGFEVFPSGAHRRFCSKLCGNRGKDKTNLGGYRPEAGKGKMGWYKGIYCNSSWELAWVVYSLEHGIKFERNSQGFDYVWENKIRKYYPDFKLLQDDLYVEVKGWNVPKWKAKREQFKHPLHVVDKHEIKKYIKYVEEKYGKDFTRLYEHSPAV